MKSEMHQLVRKIKSILKGKKHIVFTDIDKTIRWDKGPIDKDTERAVKKFRALGGVLIPITGGPRNHIPNNIISPLSFAESGALCIVGNTNPGYIIAPQDECNALEILRHELDIVGVEDGPCEILGEYTSALEGVREASITIICGMHPLYPNIIATYSISDLDMEITRIIREQSLPLESSVGTAGAYSWIDVTTTFKKEDAIDWFTKKLDLANIYFMGDGMNDYQAMALPQVIPIGFKNTIPRLQELIMLKGGLLVDSKDGPDGGVSEALDIIASPG